MKKLLFGFLLILAACGGSGAGDPADTVERYLTAKVGGDGDTMRALLCSEMESVVEREVNSFVSVTDPRIENMECTRDGDSDTVRCTGTITAVYGTEAATFDLTSYRVVQEDGEWKWCGETQ
jgi:hypothetical protein